jgi:hypothetical protein
VAVGGPCGSECCCGIGFVFAFVVFEDGCFDWRWDLEACTRVRLEEGSGGRPHDRTAAGSEAFCIGVVYMMWVRIHLFRRIGKQTTMDERNCMDYTPHGGRI